MTRAEKMKEIIKEYPDFGKGVGYKMCVVDELHDMKEALEKKAEKYADTKVDDRKGYNARWELVKNAYIAGAKENGVIWHDLRKDTNDLPKSSSLFYDVSERVIGVQEIASKQFISFECRYDFIEKKWRTLQDPYYADVIAWCEIPQFKE